LGGWFHEEEILNRKKSTKLIHEGKYLAEVDVELILAPEEWAPYLSLEDAYKLDEVREALRNGDIEAAARHGRVFSLTPVAV
jgi:hypothetical protein